MTTGPWSLRKSWQSRAELVDNQDEQLLLRVRQRNRHLDRGGALRSLWRDVPRWRLEEVLPRAPNRSWAFPRLQLRGKCMLPLSVFNETICHHHNTAAAANDYNSDDE
jgi:hypothetical protein